MDGHSIIGFLCYLFWCALRLSPVIIPIKIFESIEEIWQFFSIIFAYLLNLILVFWQKLIGATNGKRRYYSLWKALDVPVLTGPINQYFEKYEFPFILIYFLFAPFFIYPYFWSSDFKQKDLAYANWFSPFFVTSIYCKIDPSDLTGVAIRIINNPFNQNHYILENEASSELFGPIDTYQSTTLPATEFGNTITLYGLSDDGEIRFNLASYDKLSSMLVHRGEDYLCESHIAWLPTYNLFPEYY